MTASPNIAATKLGLRMTTLHEEQSSSGSHSGLEMSPLLQEEEPCSNGEDHPSGIVGSGESSRTSNVSSGKVDADGTHSDSEFSEFESYQVCLVIYYIMMFLHLTVNCVCVGRLE
jgi:hypothetical protein